MAKYRDLRFQKKAQAKYLETIKFINYREAIRAYAADQADPDLLRNALGDGYDSFRIQIDAPTGSGKTVMMANILKDYHKEYVCLVFSPGAGNLQEQTAGRLAEIMGDANVALVDDTTFSQELATGVAYVGNWEKFVSREKTSGDYKNKIVREGDNRNFFDAIREVGNRCIPVIICIDEAHHGKGSAMSSIRTFLNDIKLALGYSPLYVEISATPILEGIVHQIKILLSDVQKEELIRKSIRLNGAGLLAKVDALTGEQRASQAIEPFLIDHSIELQNRIDAQYIAKDIHEIIDNKKVYCHSLIGLQIPSGNKGTEARLRTEAYLRDKYGITRENDKLFVYLSDDNDKISKKALLKSIASQASPIKVLIYKQGISVGWDCPRAQILLGFRHITSWIFTRQNIGRYVRTIQQKYYGDDLLDHTYVISNVGDLGEASFGDQVDTNFTYEKESILRIGAEGYTALSSLNKAKLPISHYARVDQTHFKHQAIKAKWESAAAAERLWERLGYSRIADLGNNKMISGTMSVEELDSRKGFSQDLESKAMAEDNAKQYSEFKSKVHQIITDNGRDYGSNVRVAVALSNIIIRWYREAVWGQPDANVNHVGKLRDIKGIIGAEKDELLRFGETDENDFAVEQLSLDPVHLWAVRVVILKTLSALESTEIGDEETYCEKGLSSDRRELTQDGTFVIPVTEPVWTPAIEENQVGLHGIGSASHYAYRIASDDSLAYREGGATLSGPEESFEKNFLASIISAGDSRIRLAYYMKSPENNNRSYRIAVTSLDGSKVSDFYPDYLGERYDPKSKTYTPFIIEVKSEADVIGALKQTDSLLLGKAKALVDLSAKYSVHAGVAYEVNHGKPEAEWRVVTKVTSAGSIETSGLREWLVG